MGKDKQKNAAAGAGKRFAAALKRIACRQSGGPRAVWTLALGCTAYLAWASAAAWGLTRAFQALFAAWGLTEGNLRLAPGWARFLVGNYGSIVSLVSSLGTMALSALLLRMLGKRQIRPKAGDAALGAGIGLAVVLVSAGLFRLTDSMRLTHGLAAARLSGEMLALLPAYLAAAWAEEMFNRAFVFAALSEETRARYGGWPACAVSAALLWLTTGALNYGAVGSINMLLTGCLCARLHQRGRAGLSAGMRFAWSYAAVALVSFPGGNAANAPLLRLYHVSEALLTGGDRGLICGLWMTALLAGGLTILVYRERKTRGNAL